MNQFLKRLEASEKAKVGDTIIVRTLKKSYERKVTRLIPNRKQETVEIDKKIVEDGKDHWYATRASYRNDWFALFIK